RSGHLFGGLLDRFGTASQFERGAGGGNGAPVPAAPPGAIDGGARLAEHRCDSPSRPPAGAGDDRGFSFQPLNPISLIVLRHVAPMGSCRRPSTGLELKYKRIGKRRSRTKS